MDYALWKLLRIDSVVMFFKNITTEALARANVLDDNTQRGRASQRAVGG